VSACIIYTCKENDGCHGEARQAHDERANIQESAAAAIDFVRAVCRSRSYNPLLAGWKSRPSSVAHRPRVVFKSVSDEVILEQRVEEPT